MDLVRDRIDPEKAKRGTKFNLDDDTWVKVRRWNNPEYRTRILELREDWITANKHPEDQTLPDDVTRDIMAKAMSECVLVDWGGFFKDGEELPFSVKAAYDFLSDEGFEEEMMRIINAANSRARFMTERAKVKLKKS